MELNFIIDTNTGKGYILGSQGSAEVFVVKQSSGISFVEITGTGNVMSTVIDKQMNSTHSRHTIIFGEAITSQYYGKCIKK